MDELSRYNRERWNDLARAGILYSRPFLDLDTGRAREVVDEEGVLGDVTGKRVLLLGGGGGQQSAAMALLGARVTVLDLSDEQLERDRQAARHYGFEPELHQGDMRDLSRYDDDSFDVVWQPYSINFVPAVQPVFAEVARVLRAGGLYRVMWHNPFTQTMDDERYDSERGYSLHTPYRDGEIDAVAIFGTDNWTIWHEDETTSETLGPRAFRHTMSTFVNGLVARGFVILHFSEHGTHVENPEPGSWEHYKSIAPPFLTFWCRLLPAVLVPADGGA